MSPCMQGEKREFEALKVIPMGNKDPQNEAFCKKKMRRLDMWEEKGRLAMGIGLGGCGCGKRVPKNKGLVEKKGCIFS